MNFLEFTFILCNSRYSDIMPRTKNHTFIQTCFWFYSSKMKQFTDFHFSNDKKRFLTENFKIRINTNFSF